MLEPELRALLTRHNVDMEDVRTLLAIWRDPASSPMDQANAISGLDEVNLACVLEELHPAYLAQRAELERLRSARSESEAMLRVLRDVYAEGMTPLGLSTKTLTYVSALIERSSTGGMS